MRVSYPLLADPERSVGHALGLVRRLGIAGWTVELLRRATVLADRQGIIVAAWGGVKIRGHAAEVLAAARSLIAKP